MRGTIVTETVDWLVRTGFPFDWSVPGNDLPEPLRLPLAEAWYRHSNGTAETSDTVADWLRTLAQEGAWTEVPS
jgi:hypothetical protein